MVLGIKGIVKNMGVKKHQPTKELLLLLTSATRAILLSAYI